MIQEEFLHSSAMKSTQTQDREEKEEFYYVRPQVYPIGSIVIALVSLSVRWSVGLLVCWSIGPLVRWSVGPSVFKHLENRSFVFSESLHKVRGQ